MADKTDNTNCVGPGWAHLIRILDAQADKFEIRVAQVKEKFGGLRYYYDSPQGINEEDATQFERLVSAAETIAVYTCEMCGKPGKSACPGGWYKTLCEAHEAEYTAKAEARKNGQRTED